MRRSRGPAADNVPNDTQSSYRSYSINVIEMEVHGIYIYTFELERCMVVSCSAAAASFACAQALNLFQRHAAPDHEGI